MGDFGLVALPDAEPLATDARPVGSRHYMPYEMFTKPSTADPYAVDVYYLAKTLWVQLTEQNYPSKVIKPRDPGTSVWSTNDPTPARWPSMVSSIA